jgi:hypothetical protein
MTSFPWLKKIYTLVEQAETDAAVDILYECIDDLLLAGQFEDIDTLFTCIDLTKLNTEMILAILSVTAAGSKVLSERLSFGARARARLIELGHTGDKLEQLLTGLKS